MVKGFESYVKKFGFRYKSRGFIRGFKVGSMVLDCVVERYGSC